MSRNKLRGGEGRGGEGRGGGGAIRGSSGDLGFEDGCEGVGDHGRGAAAGRRRRGRRGCAGEAGIWRSGKVMRGACSRQDDDEEWWW